ncbi:hypothetical protein BASA50_003229 [Batrachochytrium salamandrivorans]|uniref:Small-subunit processome Utp12 domain-containing protein n=1 Tax=Batrachochytrium salamandrivorans TaxID=1357716 RepID=A0ABQ8FM99_9FUNG|nr:hypothetical protein BASA60_000028 [Batrachochytrium salamandrivorans]KAH6563457.1 hypothetical protein BASA62_008551 [Batrachochytrium salamandrivorans]KAH6599201.1 hypothetical protein BASA50_003229 [Batrachochytrium salamandrivorans]KAH6601847.1 hypothetical protein BASA61_001740 [Batrachochytrium salamandrivorans]KAJ1342939.1 hypothetical protein BSLG_002596 [Batrachochytrium salamandrivorans]
MGVKLYQRYKSQTPFGLIASPIANILFDTTVSKVASAVNAQHIYSPQLDSIGVIHLKQGIQVASLREESTSAQLTRLALGPSGALLAAGYSDGAIRIWDTNSKTCIVTFNGHRASVTALAFDFLGTRLASGSSDTDIVLWDIVAECGLFRLRGHKDQVTCLRFLTKNGLDHLVSGSKDSLVKFWDIPSKHCVETLTTHRGEVWALEVSPIDEKVLFTGAADGQIRVWSIDVDTLASKFDPTPTVHSTSFSEATAEVALKSAIVLVGILERQSKERIVTLKMDNLGHYIGVHGTDKLIEIFKVRSDAEVEKKLERRRRRNKRDTKGNATGEESVDVVEAKLSDRYPKSAVIRCTSKVTSFDFCPSSVATTSAVKQNVALKIVCALSNNSIEAYDLTDAADAAKSGEASSRLITTVDLAGHRSDIRSLSLSSDDELIATGSNDLVKIWSSRTRQCLKSMDSGYVLCSAFLPGNKHLVVGTKSGEIQLFDLPSSSLLESIQAHDGPVWSLQVRSDNNGIITGSQDKQVKFWDLRLMQDDAYSNVAKRATLVHMRTLKLSDDVLCIRQSPDGRLLAVALLDCTIKIFYYDTLKFFLSLYGHKLPVVSMDISFDSNIIATASSDKSVKIWGLDFGDCHRSLHAHEDSVMACQFVWGTHYLFTASKDRTIKYWDADKFEQITRLEGHCGEVWALAVAKYGSFIVTGSHDRSIRIWEKTDDQFTIEEEHEREIEKRHELDTLVENHEYQAIGSGAPDADTEAGMNAAHEVGVAGSKTVDTLKSGEKIIEALAVWEKERADFNKYDMLRIKDPNTAPPPRSPFVIATGRPDMLPEEYVLYVVGQIRSSQLDEALLVLPFTNVIDLLKCVSYWIQKGWNTRLTARVLFFLLQTHHHEMVSTRALRPILEQIRTSTRHGLEKERDRIGYNVAGIRFLQREYNANHSSFFDEDGVHDSSDIGTTHKDKASGVDQTNGKKKRRHIKVVT